MLVSISEAAMMIGVSVSTLRRWESENSFLPTNRTVGGHRRYSTESIKTRFFNQAATAKKETILYARVSSYDQRQDLERQIERLQAFSRTLNVSSLTLLSDLGSGLNFKKKGLQKLIKQICTGQVERIVLTHKDRLLRFGSELIFNICKQYGTEVTILSKSENRSFEEELASDVIELMTVFCSKIYGKRSHQNKLNKKAA